MKCEIQAGLDLFFLIHQNDNETIAHLFFANRGDVLFDYFGQNVNLHHAIN